MMQGFKPQGHMCKMFNTQVETWESGPRTETQEQSQVGVSSTSPRLERLLRADGEMVSSLILGEKHKERRRGEVRGNIPGFVFA